MPDEREYEQTVSREEAATALRRVADGVLGGTVRVGETDEGTEVEIPERMELEVEFETEEDELSLEVELEWPTDPANREAADDGAEKADGSGASAEEASDAVDETEAAGRASSDAVDRTAVAEEPPTVPGAAKRPASGARFEVFEDRADEWRWRLVHRNGNVIATSGEGYTRKHDARKGLQSVLRNAPSAEIVEADGPRE